MEVEFCMNFFFFLVVDCECMFGCMGMEIQINALSLGQRNLSSQLVFFPSFFSFSKFSHTFSQTQTPKFLACYAMESLKRWHKFRARALTPYEAKK